MTLFPSGFASRIRNWLALLILTTTSLLAGNKGSGNAPDRFKSPDGKFTAVVTPADKEIGFEKYESIISILRSSGVQVSKHDFSSQDGEHGYGVGLAQWTPDSQYFVCRMSNSGGHSPMYVPVVFWSRKTKQFYELSGYTTWRTFVISPRDKVKLDSWPDLVGATVSLGKANKGLIKELH